MGCSGSGLTEVSGTQERLYKGKMWCKVHAAASTALGQNGHSSRSRLPVPVPGGGCLVESFEQPPSFVWLGLLELPA